MKRILVLLLVSAALLATPAAGAQQDRPPPRPENDAAAPEKMVARNPVSPDSRNPPGLKRHEFQDGQVLFTHANDDPASGDANANPVLRSDTPHDECVADNSKPKVSLIYAYAFDVAPESVSTSEFEVRQLWASATDAYGYNLRLRHASRFGGNMDIRWRVKCPDTGLDTQPTVYRVKLSTTERATSQSELFDSITTDLKSAGFKNPDSKYLILYQDRIGCGTNRPGGQGSLATDTKNYYDNRNNGEYGNGASYSINFDCFFRSAGAGARIFMHELFHSMGGVQTTSPNHDGMNVYHPRDESDFMAYGDNTYSRCGIVFGGVEDVDCGEDDYWAGWGHDGWPSSWISQNWDAGDCWNRFQTLLDSGGYGGRWCGEEYRLRPAIYQK